MSTYQHESTRRPIPPPPSFPPPSSAPDLEIIIIDEVSGTRSPRTPRRSGPPGSGLKLADRRGLTGLGAVCLVVLCAAVAGAYDGHRSGDGLGWVFGITFVICCVVAALVAHTEDIGAVTILPPLAFLVGALACAAFRPGVVGVPFTSQVRNELLIAMLLGAPSLFIAETLTLCTTGWRGLRHKALIRARRAAR